MRAAIDIPLIANGEVWTVEDFARCQPETGCADIMLGRGAVADPLLARARRAARRSVAGRRCVRGGRLLAGCPPQGGGGACRRAHQAMAGAAAPQLPRGEVLYQRCVRSRRRRKLMRTDRCRHPQRIAARRMTGNSRFIASAQDGPHGDLDALVRRHMAHPFRKPILDYNRDAFAVGLAGGEPGSPEAPLILDAGCGVGWSTQRIAEPIRTTSFLASINRLTASVAASRCPCPPMPC